MFAALLKRRREKVRARQYVMTFHAEEEMNDDGWSIFDVENGILTGELIERQKDKTTGEWKYLIRGKTVAADDLIVVGKLGLTDRLVIITVYSEGK